MNKIIIDGKNAILGRLASYTAKQLLLGKEIVIVNCNDIVISGKPVSTINTYRDKREKGGANFKGPYFPKSPEKIIKRTIRGMLSHRQKRGRDSLKRVICYNEVPLEYENVKKTVSGKEKKIKTIKLGELSRDI